MKIIRLTILSRNMISPSCSGAPKPKTGNIVACYQASWSGGPGLYKGQGIARKGIELAASQRLAAHKAAEPQIRNS